MLLAILLAAPRLSDPQAFADLGAAVGQEAVLASDEIVGYLNGCAIPAAVQYRGMRYRFDRIAPSSYRYAVRPGELFVEPGLLYIRET